jgi:non-ribosomal peptide synthetase-like protein
LHHFFEAACDINPKRVAVVDGAIQCSYEELDAQANSLSHYLMGQGIGSGCRVGILLPSSIRTYTALLAVLKAGAAFVPLDPSFPGNRIVFIAADANLSAILTTSSLAGKLPHLSCPLLALDELAKALADLPSTRPEVQTTTAGDEEVCYIMYTSGTTGRPKGVAVGQKNICNFLSVVGTVYGVTAADRVYQGMTIAFDFSIEEIWPTFMAGACLVIPSSDDHRFGEGLVRLLTEQRVSVLVCVPTLLATIDCDIPSLRLLIVGGEACPQDLIARWSRPGLRMLNTYGPTEGTVTATWTELTPDRPVTIGRPLPTYHIHILDEELKPVAPGMMGEIHIGGPGVAFGYINCPELTQERFIPDPFANPPDTVSRLYKTGDLGRLTSEGEIEFCGRRDTQVKIRGYRIELAEIESLLREAPEVENAIAAVWQPNGYVQDLIAYIKPRRSDRPPAVAALHEKLHQRLPTYMVPAYLEIINEIPVMPSGKVDRAQLPGPQSSRLVLSRTAFVAPEDPLEIAIAKVWANVFQQESISVEDNFFHDLGGHSLFAARAVSASRRDPRMSHLGISDLYAHPTVRQLARFVATQDLSRASNERAACENYPAFSSKRLSVCGSWTQCAVAQAVSLYFLIAVFSPEMLVPVHFWAQLANTSGLIWAATWTLTISFFLVLLMSLILPILTKWLVLGRCKPGSYPLWGTYFFRWWLVRKVQAIAPVQFMAGSPLLPMYFRLMGARVGRHCHIGTSHFEVPDLIDIGEETSIGCGTRVCGYRVEGGRLHIGPIRIGSGCYVGNNSVLLPGAVMADRARLGDQSLLSQGQTVPAHESWSGSPARRAERADAVVDALAACPTLPPTWFQRFLLGIAHTLGFLCLFLVPTLAALPGVVLMAKAKEVFQGWWFVLFAPAAGVLFVICLCAVIAGIKRSLLPDVKAGLYPLHGWFYLRKWFTDNLVDMSLILVQSLYATLYLAPWLRLLGSAVGRRAEVSTASHITPDLLEIGDESFIADAACIGPACVFNGVLSLAPTQLGRRSFLGNSAFMPGRSSLADGCLVGVLSVPPVKPAKPGTSWVGSPAFLLPRRQPSENFGETLTYAPSLSLIIQRLGFEFFRVILPPTLQFASVGALIGLSFTIRSHTSFILTLLAFPALYFGVSLCATAVVILIKKILIGTYRPLVRPLWSNFVRRTELVTGLYENVTVPMLLGFLTGTPFIAPILRAFGARIGRRTFLETTYLTEFDLVNVGDEAMVGPFASLQTHLFEDRVMKMSHVHVGEHCSIGTRAVVLYDSVMEERSSLEALSLLMKGESLPAGTRWWGVPARRWCG